MEQTKALNALEPFLALSKSATSPRAASDLVVQATSAPNTYVFAELLRSLDGVSEYDVRRPLTPTGTNLLGLVKHVAGVELGYLVEAVGREAPVLPWNEDGSVWEGADMWPLASESREYLVDLYRSVWALTDASIAALPLDAPATVARWPEDRRETIRRAGGGGGRLPRTACSSPPPPSALRPAASADGPPPADAAASGEVRGFTVPSGGP